MTRRAGVARHRSTTLPGAVAGFHPAVPERPLRRPRSQRHRIDRDFAGDRAGNGSATGPATTDGNSLLQPISSPCGHHQNNAEHIRRLHAGATLQLSPEHPHVSVIMCQQTGCSTPHSVLCCDQRPEPKVPPMERPGWALDATAVASSAPPTAASSTALPLAAAAAPCKAVVESSVQGHFAVDCDPVLLQLAGGSQSQLDPSSQQPDSADQIPHIGLLQVELATPPRRCRAAPAAPDRCACSAATRSAIPCRSAHKRRRSPAPSCSRLLHSPHVGHRSMMCVDWHPCAQPRYSDRQDGSGLTSLAGK